MLTDRIPITRMGDVLLVTLQGSIRDRIATALQDDLAEAIVHRPTRGVLIDVSGLDVIDSFMSRMLGGTASMARVLGAQAVVVGMQPAVAITLVELGLSMPGVRTALSLERGLALLDRTNETARGRARRHVAD